MFTDDIPRDWVGKEVGCYTTRDSAIGAHIGTLLKVGADSLIVEENGDPTLYNMAFVYKVTLRTTEVEPSGKGASRKAAAPHPPDRQCAEDN